MGTLKIKSNPLALISMRIILVCIACASSSAFAIHRKNEVQYTRAYDECVESSNGVTITLRKCANEELQRQDTRLNRLYKKLINASESSDREKLKAAQSAWIQFRDRQCEYDAGSEKQGTMWPLMVTSCHLDFTIRRADEIESWILQR